MNAEQSTSIQQLNSRLFEIHNANSTFNQYYHMSAPFSAVVETYRSDLPQSYFKMAYFSPEDISHVLIDEEDLLSSMKRRPLHQHDFFEFMFVLQGEATVKIENTERIYPAGTGCIVNCNLRHVELLSNDFRIFFLNLSREYVRSLLNSPNIFQFTVEKSASLCSVFQFLYENTSQENPVKKEYLDFFPVFQNTASYQKVYALEERIVKTILSPSIGATFLINGLICRLFDLLSSETLFHISMVDIDSGNDFLLFTKLTHLLEDSDGRLSRRDLSKLLNYSGDYLNRISRKYSGMTLFEYGMTFCLRKAEYYLLKTDVSVSEIARLLGFTNRSHFYRVFKGKHGMTPKEYRIKYRRCTQGENLK